MSETIRIKIFATAFSQLQTINVSQDSKVPIELELADYAIPAGAKVVAYARGNYSGNTYKSDCTYSGNVITLIPPDGFFVPGPNAFQAEINGQIIPFALTVQCRDRVSQSGNPTTPERIIPYVERAENAASSAESAMKKASGYSAAAGESASTATQAAQSAASAAAAAGRYAENASGSASTAGSAALSAAESKSAAERSAASAAESETKAGEHEENAKTSEQNANSASANATNQATSAVKSAEAAKKSEQNAKTSQDNSAKNAESAKSAAAEANNALEKTSALVVRTPYIGDNGHWYVWSLAKEQFVDSGAESRGTPPAINGCTSEYQIASNGTSVPTGAWAAERPVTPQGQYLWTRVTAAFATGNVVWYSVDYRAIDGEQSVASEIGLRVVDGALCQVFIG